MTYFSFNVADRINNYIRSDGQTGFYEKTYDQTGFMSERGQCLNSVKQNGFVSERDIISLKKRKPSESLCVDKKVTFEIPRIYHNYE